MILNDSGTLGSRFESRRPESKNLSLREDPKLLFFLLLTQS